MKIYCMALPRRSAWKVWLVAEKIPFRSKENFSVTTSFISLKNISFWKICHQKKQIMVVGSLSWKILKFFVLLDIPQLPPFPMSMSEYREISACAFVSARCLFDNIFISFLWLQATEDENVVKPDSR